MPRRSRQIAREDAVEPFADIDPSENHGTINENNRVTMLHKATGNYKKEYIYFKPNLHVNSMLKEAVHIVKIRNNMRYLENYIVSFLLMSAKEGI